MDYTNILKIAKSMKRPIIHVNKSYMLGTDVEFGTLSMIDITSDIETPFTTIFTDILTEATKDKLVMSRPDIFFNEYKDLDGLYINDWNEDKLRDNIFRLFRKIMLYLRANSPVHSADGLEKFPEFVSKVSKIKVDDGLIGYTFARDYFVTSFNKVHSINATDKVALNVYDIDPISYLYEFLIDKKKYILKEYIRYRKVPRF